MAVVSLAIDVIDRVRLLQRTVSHTKELLRDMQIDCRHHAHQHGIYSAEVREWFWPF